MLFKFLLFVTQFVWFPTLALAQAQSRARPQPPKWEATFIDSAGKVVARKSAEILALNQDGRPLVFLAVETTALAAKDLKPNDAVRIDSRGGKYFYLLSSSRGQIESSTPGRRAINFQVEPTAQVFTVANSCRPLGLKTNYVGGLKPNVYPGLLTCYFQGGVLFEILFSTTTDAQWFGTEVFETAGKGERWKSFAPKEFLSTKGIELSWGSEAQKSTVRVVAPKANSLAAANLILPPFRFRAGMAYLAGQTTGTSSGGLKGLQIPLEVILQNQDAWWSLGAGYDLLAYSLTKTAGVTSQTDKFRAWAGAQKSLGATNLRVRAGYMFRSLQLPGVNASFSAPQAGLEAELALQNSAVGLSVDWAATTGSGSFNEANVGVYYEQVLLFRRSTRFILTDTVLHGANALNTVSATWLTLGLSVQF